MATEIPNIVGPEYLVPLLHRTVETIRTDVHRRPESLPPRFKIPGSNKLLWVEADVLAWIERLREKSLNDADKQRVRMGGARRR